MALYATMPGAPNFLDDLPFDFGRDESKKLLSLLASAYGKSDDLRDLERIVEQAGLEPEHLNLNGTGEDVCAGLIRVARDQGKLRALLAEIQQDPDRAAYKERISALLRAPPSQPVNPWANEAPHKAIAALLFRAYHYRSTVAFDRLLGVELRQSLPSGTFFVDDLERALSGRADRIAKLIQNAIKDESISAWHPFIREISKETASGRAPRREYAANPNAYLLCDRVNPREWIDSRTKARRAARLFLCSTEGDAYEYFLQSIDALRQEYKDAIVVFLNDLETSAERIFHRYHDDPALILQEPLAKALTIVDGEEPALPEERVLPTIAERLRERPIVLAYPPVRPGEYEEGFLAHHTKAIPDLIAELRKQSGGPADLEALLVVQPIMRAERGFGFLKRWSLFSGENEVHGAVEKIKKSMTSDLDFESDLHHLSTITRQDVTTKLFDIYRDIYRHEADGKLRECVEETFRMWKWEEGADEAPFPAEGIFERLKEANEGRYTRDLPLGSSQRK